MLPSIAARKASYCKQHCEGFEQQESQDVASSGILTSNQVADDFD